MIFTGFIVLLAICGSALVVPLSRADDELPPFYGPDNVTLYLFTQDNRDVPELITLDNSTSPSFNPKNPTRIYIHGGTSYALAYKYIGDAFFATGNPYNVILVDWSGISHLVNTVAMQLSISVADYVGEIMDHMINERGLDVNSLHIIGHSMGGQTAGIVGNRVGGGAAQELIALDPASVLYEKNRPEDKLDPTDAKFVQVIHTEGGGLGILENRGDADFFPNGGSQQAGCNPTGICNHLRAIDYFVESISSDEFVATLCSSYEDYLTGVCKDNEHVAMGEGSPLAINGSYYLLTNEDSPFAQGRTDL